MTPTRGDKHDETDSDAVPAELPDDLGRDDGPPRGRARTKRGRLEKGTKLQHPDGTIYVVERVSAGPVRDRAADRRTPTRLRLVSH